MSAYICYASDLIDYTLAFSQYYDELILHFNEIKTYIHKDIAETVVYPAVNKLLLVESRRLIPMNFEPVLAQMSV